MKKIIKIFLICTLMFLVLSVTASAKTNDIIASVVVNEENGSFNIIFASTTTDLTAFAVRFDYDDTKYILTSKKKSNVFIYNLDGIGEINCQNSGQFALIWYGIDGMIDRDTFETMLPNQNGNFDIAMVSFENNESYLTESDYDS